MKKCPFRVNFNLHSYKIGQHLSECGAGHPPINFVQERGPRIQSDNQAQFLEPASGSAATKYLLENTVLESKGAEWMLSRVCFESGENPNDSFDNNQ